MAHNVKVYSVLDTVVISGDDVCCSAVFGIMVGVFVLCGPSCLSYLLLVVHCGHQCTSAIECYKQLTHLLSSC